ncbi:hypothetical protein ONZ43_g3085 [Nemania bipapillata]|uniref:Uncharacterized protein n=1 Tax=Nemania bipapillata TaxID=110536 RepID=A0ACC2IYD8_9PEZI|nr:hypothetical protein ONZ43_g3085 [Nemania bipapillata]
MTPVAPELFFSQDRRQLKKEQQGEGYIAVFSGASGQNGDDEAAPDGKESSTDIFAPAALAKATNAFLRDTVLRLEPLPTHILIERQRWRSGGSSAIQEWTVRVNTLEAMLHASLRTLHDVGVWKGAVMSIHPQRVGQLFLDPPNLGTEDVVPIKELEELEEGDEAEEGVDASNGRPQRKRVGGKKTSAETKKMKIDLLSGWLSQGNLVVRPGTVEAGHMLAAYRNATNGVRRSRSKRAAEENAEATPLTLDRKLDDLTDSLMQENGVEQLLE